MEVSGVRLMNALGIATITSLPPFYYQLSITKDGIRVANGFYYKRDNCLLDNTSLVVMYQGNPGSALLALDYLVVQNAASASASSAPTGVHGTTSITSTSVPSIEQFQAY
ncbi:hypothetical protein BYT27DRAFT_7212815 [Phlegmacium glaucopus]|nr:hypothetical protein BYT27DRAFT_7212815 [Phlegmacium glaucopus]